MKRRRIIVSLAASVLVVTVAAVVYWNGMEHRGGIRWPEDQALPSFSEPAPTLELISLTDKLIYEAEDEVYGHEVGRKDGDGWPAEGQGVIKTSEFGLATVAADFSSNLSVLSGISRKITPVKTPPKPPLENKTYVSYIMSDGDNLQYMERFFSKLWALPNRGEIPIGWTYTSLVRMII